MSAYPTNHLAIPHIITAIDALYAAMSDLRAGPDGYRAEYQSVRETIETLESVLQEVKDNDELRDPEAMAERKAWDRQTRANWGPL